MSSNNNLDKGQPAKDSDKSTTTVGKDVAADVCGGIPAMVMDEPKVLTDIVMWSELSKYITAFNPTALKEIGSDASVKVQLNCGICRAKRLLLPAWINHDQPDLTSAEGSFEQVCVLPCGHFFGADCIETWMNCQAQEDKTPTCPSCRFELIHPVCEHPIHLSKVPSKLSAENPKDILHYVPYTRVHKLQPGDEMTFVDVSGWGPEDINTTNDFGVPDECCSC